MRQSIRTKHIPATNHKAARVGARCQAGAIFVPWDYSLSTEQNHKNGRVILLVKLGWETDGWHMGWMDYNTAVHVQEEDRYDIKTQKATYRGVT